MTTDDRHHRDRLLALAREVLSVTPPDSPPPTVTATLRAALAAHAARPVEVEPDFAADAATGVEALAFAVGAPGASRPGGLILRLPGELPDSFEPVEGPGSATDLRRAWFDPARAPGRR